MSVCNRDCLNCVHPDCICDEMTEEEMRESLDSVAFSDGDRRRIKNRAYKKAYYEKHREEINAKRRRWYKANKKRLRQVNKAWRESNAERVRAQARARYAKRKKEDKNESMVECISTNVCGGSNAGGRRDVDDL